MPQAPETVERGQWKTVRMQVIDRIESLPSLSSVVSEFMELAKREYCTAKDFEKIIVKDQALVARLLKVANSGLFGGSRTVKTIPDAIVRVGLDNMKNMVYAVSTGGMMRRELQNYRYPGKGFWLHAMGVGMACRALSEVAERRGMDGEEAFVAGLLHDVAKLIIDEFLTAASRPRKVTLEEEVEACGLDHAELAQHIMGVWGIPETIAEAVRYHHDPRPDGQWRQGAAMVNLADAVCHVWGVGTQQFMDLGEEVYPNDYSDAREALGIRGDKMQQALWQLRQKLAKLEEFYDEE